MTMFSLCSLKGVAKNYLLLTKSPYDRVYQIRICQIEVSISNVWLVVE